MQRLTLWLCWLAFGLTVGTARAEDFKLADGTALSGEAISFNDKGVVIKQTSGAYSERIAWDKFAQETLKVLAQKPKAAEFAETYIEYTTEEKQQAKQREIVLKEVPRVPRVVPHGLLAAFTTPAGLLLFLAFIAANVFAGYEIAAFRNQPAALVCALSAFLPVIGPIIFLSLPTQELAVEEEAAPAEDYAPAAAAPAEPAASTTSRIKNKLTSVFQKPPPGGGLKVRATEKPAETSAGDTAPRVFRRGEVTFGRRFVEMQFPGFFRMVPSEAEKDLILFVKSSRGEFIAKRISRISANEMHIQMQRGSASAEVGVPFDEIVEIQVRHKDAKN